MATIYSRTVISSNSQAQHEGSKSSSNICWRGAVPKEYDPNGNSLLKAEEECRALVS